MPSMSQGRESLALRVLVLVAGLLCTGTSSVTTIQHGANAASSKIKAVGRMGIRSGVRDAETESRFDSGLSSQLRARAAPEAEHAPSPPVTPQTSGAPERKRWLWTGLNLLRNSWHNWNMAPPRSVAAVAQGGAREGDASERDDDGAEREGGTNISAEESVARRSLKASNRNPAGRRCTESERTAGVNHPVASTQLRGRSMGTFTPRPADPNAKKGSPPGPSAGKAGNGGKPASSGGKDGASRGGNNLQSAATSNGSKNANVVLNKEQKALQTRVSDRERKREGGRERRREGGREGGRERET